MYSDDGINDRGINYNFIVWSVLKKSDLTMVRSDRNSQELIIDLGTNKLKIEYETWARNDWIEELYDWVRNDRIPPHPSGIRSKKDASFRKQYIKWKTLDE